MFIIYHQTSVKDVLAHDHNFICHEFVFFIEELIPCVQNGRGGGDFLEWLEKQERMNETTSLLGKGDKGILGRKQSCSHVVVAVLSGE